ncbi:MAG: hypothetical protein ACKPJJ_00305, partial [Planctomycetaceae bacterium]
MLTLRVIPDLTVLAATAAATPSRLRHGPKISESCDNSLRLSRNPDACDHLLLELDQNLHAPATQR